MNDETLGCVRNLVMFVEDTEHGKPICEDAAIVRQWLGPDSDLPTKECPNCHKMTMEIHGEGITSYGRHFPMEECSDCGHVPSEMPEETKAWLIDTLESWGTTFEEETDIPILIAKIQGNETLTADEYDEIIFHLWQKLYDVEPPTPCQSGKDTERD